MVKDWLIDSMSPSLMHQLISLPTAKEIWEAISKTFYGETDGLRTGIGQYCVIRYPHGQKIQARKRIGIAFMCHTCMYTIVIYLVTLYI